MRKQEGFTLPELLATGAVLIVLVALVTFILRPHTYAVESRNAQRWLGAAQLAQGLRAYVRDHGSFPDGLQDTPQPIGSEEDSVDLCPFLVPAYMKDVPLDPQGGAKIVEQDCLSTGAVYAAGYTIEQAKDGTVTIAATTTENNEPVSVSFKLR